jgi:hypothetical protein
MIIACGCEGNCGVSYAATFQDQAYGYGMRAHNPTTKDGVWRCTVCGRENKHGGGTGEKIKSGRD